MRRLKLSKTEQKALGGGPFFFPGRVILLPPFCQSFLRLAAAVRFAHRPTRASAPRNKFSPGRRSGLTLRTVRQVSFARFAALARQGIRPACRPPRRRKSSFYRQRKTRAAERRPGHRISYSVVGEPNRRYLYIFAIISAAASRQLFARLRR